MILAAPPATEVTWTVVLTSVITSVVVATIVAIVVDFTIKPQAEARKERVVETAKAKRTFAALCRSASNAALRLEPPHRGMLHPFYKEVVRLVGEMDKAVNTMSPYVHKDLTLIASIAKRVLAGVAEPQLQSAAWVDSDEGRSKVAQMLSAVSQAFDTPRWRRRKHRQYKKKTMDVVEAWGFSHMGIDPSTGEQVQPASPQTPELTETGHQLSTVSVVRRRF